MTSYDPAKTPGDKNYLPYQDCLEQSQSDIVGPGGNKNLSNNNEKGILEANLFGVIATLQYAELGSNHDAERQGIYATNSVGDRD